VLKSVKHLDCGGFEIKQIRSAFPVKQHIAKQCAEDEDASNKLMDVRAKQRLFYNGSSEPATCALPVSPHVISIVKSLL